MAALGLMTSHGVGIFYLKRIEIDVLFEFQQAVMFAGNVSVIFHHGFIKLLLLFVG